MNKIHIEKSKINKSNVSKKSSNFNNRYDRLKKNDIIKDNQKISKAILEITNKKSELSYQFLKK